MLRSCYRIHLGVLGVVLAAPAPTVRGAGAVEPAVRRTAEQRLQSLAERVPSFKIVDFRARPRRVVLSEDDSITIEDLRGVDLDESPPVPGTLSNPYHRNMIDRYPPGEAPYVARGIRPFRFEHFTCEFHCGGWHNFALVDYAAAHGFEILSPYVRKPGEKTHLPEGTRWVYSGKNVKWQELLSRDHFGDRFDRLADLHDSTDLIRRAASAGVFQIRRGFDAMLLDIEHGCLKPDKLREQDWMDRAAPLDREAARKRYYDGYALTYTLPVRIARRQGWKQIGIYGWSPFPSTWWKLAKARADPKTDWRWNAYGKQIYPVVDVVNPSVYCYYWSPQNVAYTLAIIDLNRQMIRDLPDQKPIRPFYWTRLHGGGGGWRWWKEKPMPDEEVRAMFAMGFFTGFDGLVAWDWSGTDNHHRPPSLLRVRKRKKGGRADVTDVMLNEAISLKPLNGDGASPPTEFRRYDALHVLGIEGKTSQVRFQRIARGEQKNNYGVKPDAPVYTMPRDELSRHLRPNFDAMDAMFEGMALVKPFEYLLRHGEVKIDVPAQRQFSQTLPLVRRVKLGRFHVVVTYDPARIHGGPPRPAVVRRFDGRGGLTMQFHADEQVRVFVLREN